MGETGEVTGALDTVLHLGPSYGVYINTSKARVWWHRLPAGVTASLPSGVEVCVAEGVRILGGGVSTSWSLCDSLILIKPLRCACS